MKVSLENQTAIVTGGSKGYGFGIAARLKERGVRVWITGRDENALNAAAKKLSVNAVCADAINPADWDRLFEKVIGETGRIDILVNNAGASLKVAPFEEQTDDMLANIVQLNLVAPMYGWRRAVPVMKKQGGGVIVNISSGCALHAWPGWGAYSGAKAGLNQASHSLYTEVRPFGIRVSTVTPYWGATDFVAASGIIGHPAGEEDIRKKCMQPYEMGDLVAQICELPSHLVMPDITVQPMIQEIVPM
jgi:NAD(P)-dependent dehydrogenase (short-subunit alcohol dehydrogenase family)